MYSSSPGTLCVCSTNIKYLKILNKNVQILTIFLETYLGPFVAVRVRVFVSLCKITSLKILFLSAGNKQCHPSCTFIQPSLQNTKLHILILAAFISVCEEEIPLFVVRSLYSYSALCHVLHAWFFITHRYVDSRVLQFLHQCTHYSKEVYKCQVPIIYVLYGNATIPNTYCVL